MVVLMSPDAVPLLNEDFRAMLISIFERRPDVMEKALHDLSDIFRPTLARQDRQSI